MRFGWIEKVARQRSALATPNIQPTIDTLSTCSHRIISWHGSITYKLLDYVPCAEEQLSNNKTVNSDTGTV